jgi:choline-glycine betaine transporter
MNIGKIIISTVLIGIAISVITFGIAGPIAKFINPGYDIMKVPGMRSIGDPIMLLFFLQPFVLGLAFSIIFSFHGNAMPGLEFYKKGIKFGLAGWMLYTLPSMFLIYSSMDYGETFLLSGIFGQLLEFCAAGIIAAWVFARK